MNRIRVFLVDDTAAVRHILTQILEEDPEIVVVGTASDGQQGLERLSRVEADLLILDVEMPGMGGLEACQKLRETGITARIAMLSSITSAESHMAGHKAGCNNYLVKPPHDSDLRSVMRLTSLMKQTSA